MLAEASTTPARECLLKTECRPRSSHLAPSPSSTISAYLLASFLLVCDAHRFSYKYRSLSRTAKGPKAFYFGETRCPLFAQSGQSRLFWGQKRWNVNCMHVSSTKSSGNRLASNRLPKICSFALSTLFFNFTSPTHLKHSSRSFQPTITICAHSLSSLPSPLFFLPSSLKPPFPLGAFQPSSPAL